MGSARLPGKVLMELAGVPVIRRVYERTIQIPGVDHTLVATSDHDRDNPLVEYCHRIGIPTFRGSEFDVLERYFRAAEAAEASVIVRVTADCPLIDPVVSGAVVERFLRCEHCRYGSNVQPRTYPDGLDTEVFPFGALEEAHRTAVEPREREHVTPYIADPSRGGARCSVTHPVDHSHQRWTLDYPEDFEMLDRVANELHSRNQFGNMEQILRILDDHPEIGSINAHLTQPS